jgi:hypothetical protein
MMLVLSRVGNSKGLSGGSYLGLMSVVMPVWMRVWGVHMQLMTMGIMSTLYHATVSGVRFHGGVLFNDEVVGIIMVIDLLCVQHFHSPI